jgi:pimeloyl-ACP methyl ester carboxylesterase
MPYFETDFAKFHYEEFGSGENVMLAFHGFGMRGTQFKTLEEAFGSAYKIYSFDLFFHGNTKLKNESHPEIKKGLASDFFSDQMKVFLKSIGLADTDQFSLLSYSMGARPAWSLIENFPERIKSAYFIAPDGIEPNKLIAIGAGNRLVNKLFNKLVYSPRTVKYALDKLFQFRYIDASLHRILDFEFGTFETRLICYNTITYYNSLQFEKEKLAELINTYQMDCHFYFGKADMLFPASIGTRFSKLLKRPKMHIFDEGHEMINAGLNSYLINQLTTDDKG